MLVVAENRHDEQNVPKARADSHNTLFAIVEPIVDRLKPKGIENRPLGVLEIDAVPNEIAAGPYRDPTRTAWFHIPIISSFVNQADDLFTRLMGDLVEPRRQLIKENALNAAVDV